MHVKTGFTVMERFKTQLNLNSYFSTVKGCTPVVALVNYYSLFVTGYCYKIVIVLFKFK